MTDISDMREGTVITIDSSSTLTQQQLLYSLKDLGILSRCVTLLVELGIANKISSKEGPIQVGELAKRVGGLDEGNLRRVCSFVASHGIFKEFEQDRFSGTPLSDLLRDDNERTVAPTMRFFARREVQLPLIDLGESLKSGQPSFDRIFGSSFFDYLSERPDFQRDYDVAIARYSTTVQDDLLAKFDFGRFRTIADIGGGRGGLLLRILRQHDKAHGTLFERPAVLKGLSDEELQSLQLTERFRVVEGDVLESVEQIDADLFVLANVLNNYDDEKARKICENVRRAMAKSQKLQEGSRLLLVEPDAASLEPNEPSVLRRGLDIRMMYMVGGRSRSADEWKKLLSSCGFVVANTFKLQPLHNAFECKLA